MFGGASLYSPLFRSNAKPVPIPLVGPSSQGEVSQLGSQRTINFIPVAPEREGDPWKLTNTPGITTLGTLPYTPQRGWHVYNDRLFVVSNAFIYEVYADGTHYEWGTIGSVKGRVVMASQLDTIIIGDGAKYWALDLTTSTVTELTDAPRGLFCVFFNQRIIYQGEDGQFYYSELNDPTNIPGLNFATAESLPDEIVAIVRMENDIWLFGDDSAEVWYDAGDADNPIQRVPGGVIFSGCGHPHTALRLDNSVWWVEKDKDGGGIVRRSSGFTAIRVSTTPVERFTASATNLTAYSYQENGHTFYVLNADEGTWAFDLKTQQWSERAYREPSTGEQERQRQEFHAFVYGQHMVGDYESGKVYRMGLDLRTDAGDEIRRTRVTRTFSYNGRSVIIPELWVDCATGVGIDGSGQGTDPVVMLRVAKDGASFGAELTAPLGGIGEYETQVRFFDLGIGRDWVFELSVSDPVVTGFKGAEALVRTGSR